MYTSLRKGTKDKKANTKFEHCTPLPGNINNMISSPSLGTDPLKKLFQWRHQH